MVLRFGAHARSGGLYHAGAGMSVMDLFKNRTVRELAQLIDVPLDQRGPRELVHELTRPVPVAQRVRSLVCVPYGGGSAVVYQPLAEALPAGHRLFAVTIPGHDIGDTDQDETAPPFDGRAVHRRRRTGPGLSRTAGSHR